MKKENRTDVLISHIANMAVKYLLRWLNPPICLIVRCKGLATVVVLWWVAGSRFHLSPIFSGISLDNPKLGGRI
jgi:hypothetical protein